MTTEQIQLLLQTKGYIPTIDEDGDLLFKAQGRRLYASVSDTDPDYMRFFLDLLINTGDATKLDVFEAANSAERHFKCVKCMILRHDDEGIRLRVAVECFTSIETLARNIERYIDIICATTWHITRTLQSDD